MTPPRGEIARYTLTDGTTIQGVRAFTWPWSRFWKIEDPMFYDTRSREPVQAAGFILLAKQAVVLIQIGE